MRSDKDLAEKTEIKTNYFNTFRRDHGRLFTSCLACLSAAERAKRPNGDFAPSHWARMEVTKWM